MATTRLDKAYTDFLDVCKGRPLAGFSPTLNGVGSNLSESELQFAGWLETMGESTRRFTAESSRFVKANGGGGYIGQYCADGQYTQFCDYAVDNWDNISGAAKVLREREIKLMSEGKMFPLDGRLGSFNNRPVTPNIPGGKYIRPGKFKNKLQLAKYYHDHGVGNLYGDTDVEFVDKISADESILSTASFGMVENLVAEYAVDLGELGVAGFERVMDVPYDEVNHLRGIDGTLGGVGAPFYYQGGVGSLDGKVGEWFKRMWKGFCAACKKAWHWLGKIVKEAVIGIRKAVKWTIEKAKKVISWTGEKLADFHRTMAATFDKIGTALGRAFTFVKNGIKYVWDKTKGFLKWVGGKLVEALEATWKFIKEYAKKIAEVFKKFINYLNPKNIIGRTIIMYKLRNGKDGIATGVYYGMIGKEESKRLGIEGDKFNKSKEAYEKLRNEYVRRFYGSEDSLKKYIRVGFGKYDGKTRTESDFRNEISNTERKLDKNQLIADAQQEVKRREGLNGLGNVDIVSMIVKFFEALFNLIMSILNFIRGKKQRKHESEQTDKMIAENQKVREHEKEVLEKNIKEKEKEREAIAEKEKLDREQAIKQTASISKYAAIGVGLLVALSAFKNHERNKTMQSISNSRGSKKGLKAGRTQPRLALV